MSIKRITVMKIIMMGAIFALIFRVGYLAIVQGEELSMKAVSQRVVDVDYGQNRGTIYDRNMVALTGGEDDTYLVVFPGIVEGDPQSIRTCESVLGLEEGSLGGDSLRRGGGKSYKIEKEVLPFIEEACQKISGVTLVKSPSRYSGIATHVIGYISGAKKGESGIEAAWNSLLSKSGGSVVSAFSDSMGQEILGMGIRVRELTMEESWVKLSLDREIQLAAEEAMKNATGAVVVMEVATGNILSMVSTPAYDPNDYILYLESQNAPFINRALEPRYPGSVFKTVLAIAALETGKVGDGAYYDAGSITVGSHTFKCLAFDRGGHGWVDFTRAFAVSCNSAFINYGLILGADPIVECAKRLGVGKSWDIGMGNMKVGTLPALPIGNIAVGNLSLGQAVVMMTPLEMAVAMSAIANDGVLNAPKLVLETSDNEGTVTPYEYEESYRVLTSEVAAKTCDLLKEVVTSGTAASSVRGVSAAGKTGTAQTGRLADDGTLALDTWFAGYIDADDPRYVIVVMVEGGLSGSSSAAPIFKQIAQSILDLEKRS